MHLLSFDKEIGGWILSGFLPDLGVKGCVFWRKDHFEWTLHTQKQTPWNKASKFWKFMEFRNLLPLTDSKTWFLLQESCGVLNQRGNTSTYWPPCAKLIWRKSTVSWWALSTYHNNCCFARSAKKKHLQTSWKGLVTKSSCGETKKWAAGLNIETTCFVQPRTRFCVCLFFFFFCSRLTATVRSRSWENQWTW